MSNHGLFDFISTVPKKLPGIKMFSTLESEFPMRWMRFEKFASSILVGVDSFQRGKRILIVISLRPSPGGHVSAIRIIQRPQSSILIDSNAPFHACLVPQHGVSIQGLEYLTYVGLTFVVLIGVGVKQALVIVVAKEVQGIT